MKNIGKYLIPALVLVLLIVAAVFVIRLISGLAEPLISKPRFFYAKQKPGRHFPVFMRI